MKIIMEDDNKKKMEEQEEKKEERKQEEEDVLKEILKSKELREYLEAEAKAKELREYLEAEAEVSKAGVVAQIIAVGAVLGGVLGAVFLFPFLEDEAWFFFISAIIGLAIIGTFIYSYPKQLKAEIKRMRLLKKGATKSGNKTNEIT